MTTEARSLKAAPETVTGTHTDCPIESSNEEIAALAYSYWEARGCSGGSPEQDWLQAENELRKLRSQQCALRILEETPCALQ